MNLRNAMLMLALVALLVGASMVPNATSRSKGIGSMSLSRRTLDSGLLRLLCHGRR